MDETHEQKINVNPPVRGPRYERNRKYYLKNALASMRSTLLHNVKSKGRIPSMKTVDRYQISPEELLKNWRIYISNNINVPALKRVRFATLINNLTLQIRA